MSAALIQFPRPFRHPLPADAIAWRSRHVVVFPHAGRWAWLMTDDWGGAGDENLSKIEALQVGLQYVVEDHATLQVIADDLYAVEL